MDLVDVSMSISDANVCFPQLLVITMIFETLVVVHDAQAREGAKSTNNVAKTANRMLNTCHPIAPSHKMLIASKPSLLGI